MLAKITSKNQLTLPKSATQAVGATDYFDVEVRAGQIILTPVRIQRGDAVRTKLSELGIGTSDVADAVAWARSADVPAAMVAEPAAAYAATPARTMPPARPVVAPRSKAATRKSAPRKT